MISRQLIVMSTAVSRNLTSYLVLEEDPHCTGRVVVSSEVEAGSSFIVSTGRVPSQLYQLRHQTRLVFPSGVGINITNLSQALLPCAQQEDGVQA